MKAERDVSSRREKPFLDIKKNHMLKKGKDIFTPAELF